MDDDVFQGYFGGATDALRGMLGKPIDRIEEAKDKEAITFYFMDGSSQGFKVEGDCCSSSWIEHLTVPDDIQGAVIQGFREESVDETDNPEMNPMVERYNSAYREHECLLVYNTTFITNKGEVVLEYRNSSNGYYGGYLVAL